MQAGIAMDRAKRARMVAAAEASSPSVDPGSSMAAAGATGQTFAWMPDDPWGVGAEASANLIEFERNTNLDWGGSEVQALHDQSKIRIQAEFVSDYIETQFGNSASVSSSAYGRIVAAVGDIPQSQLTGESYVPIFQDYGLTPEFGQWLNESGYVSVSGTNAADIIGRTSIFDLEKVVLPALELHQDYNNVRPLYDAVSKHVLGINRMADRVVWDVVSAGLSLDAPTAAYRMANGEVNWGNGITLGASFAGPLGSGAKVFFKGSADLGEGVSGLYRVGAFNQLQGTARGLDAHHVGQKALMGRFIPGYDPITAPAILVPKVGHTIRGPSGIVSRSLVGLDNARSVVARDIWELRRVYTDIPNTQLQELVKLNRSSYPEAFTKGR